MESTLRAQIYSRHLQSLPTLKEALTPREIDVIACIFNKKLNAQISNLLSIGLAGVETHIHNIMNKINCFSRSEIIDFIKQSGKSYYIQEVYLYLELEGSFVQQFQLIKRIFFPAKTTYTIFSEKSNIKSNLLFIKLKKDCEKFFNISLKLTCNLDDQKNCIFQVFTKDIKGCSQNEQKFLVFGSEIQPQYLKISANIINFCHGSYFLAVSLFIKLSLNEQRFEPYYQNLQALYHDFQEKLLNLKQQVAKIHEENKRSIRQKLITLMLILLCSAFLTALVLVYTGRVTIPTQNIIISNLNLPNKELLLKRNNMLEKIEQILSKQDGVKIVVLSGIEGSGKTTLSHQYAKTYNKNIKLVWEFNAATRETMESSLKNLAFNLCESSHDKKELENIYNIKNVNQQVERLEGFLIERVQKFQNWLVIYDNVKSFDDIQWYCPLDFKKWGSGKIIINTTNYNIRNTPIIPPTSIMDVGELTAEEKLELFSKILSDENFDSIEAMNFLNHLPPFPLDVELAAVFIKDQKMSYNEYLQYLEKPDKKFTSIQEDILIDMGVYANTRYKIISTSLEKIAVNQDFRELLLFISLLHPENILKSLLTEFKGEAIVDQLINELKKYSLIIEYRDEDIVNFSIHSSTQQGILAYLNFSDISKNSELFKAMAKILEQYMDEECEKHNITKSQIIAVSAENFLLHNELLEDSQKLGIVIALGQYYCFFGNYDKAYGYLSQALDITSKTYDQKSLTLAKIKNLLGNVYKGQGNYKKAYELFVDSYKFYQDYYGDNHPRIIELKAKLGFIYGYLENYQQAEEILESALSCYQARFSDDRIKMAEIQVQLGHIYNKLGKKEEAQKITEMAVLSYEGILSKNHVSTTRALLYLSDIYKDLSYYKKARSILNNGLETYKKFYGDKHVKVAYILEDLGILDFKEKNYTEAERFLSQALELYKANNHGKIYTCLEALGNLYIVESKVIQNIKQKSEYKIKAKNCFEQAVLARQEIFENDSPGIKNLLIKIKQLEETI